MYILIAVLLGRVCCKSARHWMTAAPEQQIGVEWAIENSSFPSSLQHTLALPIHWIHVTNGALLIFFLTCFLTYLRQLLCFRCMQAITADATLPTTQSAQYIIGIKPACGEATWRLAVYRLGCFIFASMQRMYMCIHLIDTVEATCVRQKTF